MAYNKVSSENDKRVEHFINMISEINRTNKAIYYNLSC